MAIIEYLPGIPNAYWEDFVKSIEPTAPVVIKAGQRNSTLFDPITNRRGLFLAVSIGFNNPNLTFTVRVDNRKISATATDLYEGGYLGYYIKDIPFLSSYNTTDNIYTVNLIAELPFRENANVTVSNPTTSSITIDAMGFRAILLNKGFYKALADLKSGKE